MITTNYILHLNNSFKRFTDDTRTSPFHLSLYMALFHKWNNAKFRNPISVARDDLMYLSKIGSTNTYTKCLKELDEWGYIKYSPSHSYHVGSKIYMYTFNTTKHTTTNKTTNNATDISINKTTDKTTAQDVRLYKNSLNNTNNLNFVNEPNPKNEDEKNNYSKSNSKSVQEKKEMPSTFADTKKSARNSQQKSCEKKESKIKHILPFGEERGGAPTLQEAKNYFEQNDWLVLEAEKFYNYFESNGWLVGGKTPMKNWHAAAKNWVLNSNNFNNGKNKQTPQQHHTAGKLHTSTDKNFSEPL